MLYMPYRDALRSIQSLDDYLINDQLKVLSQLLSSILYYKIKKHLPKFNKPFITIKNIEYIKYYSSSKYLIMNLLDYGMLLNNEYLYRYNNNYKNLQIFIIYNDYIEYFDERGYEKKIFNKELLNIINDNSDIYSAYQKILIKKWLLYEPCWTKRESPIFWRNYLSNIK